MDSKDIYNTSAAFEKKYNYTYLITNIENGRKYIGVHSCNRAEEAVGIKYFSTSTDKDFIKEQKKHPERFEYEILQMFNTREEAEKDEEKRHKEIDVAKNEEYYNLCNAPMGFSGYGRVTVKDKDGKTFSVSKDDPRWISGELVSVNKGMVTVRDKNGNRFSVQKDDPRYLSGEWVHNSKGFKHDEETYRKIGELKKDIFLSEDHRRKISESMKGKNVGEKSSWFGRTGDKHPNSKKIQTPDGIFASRAEAAKHYGVVQETIRNKMKRYPDQYFYL